MPRLSESEPAKEEIIIKKAQRKSRLCHPDLRRIRGACKGLTPRMLYRRYLREKAQKAAEEEASRFRLLAKINQIYEKTQRIKEVIEQMKNIKKIDGQSVYYNILVKILLNGVLLRL